MFADVLIPRLRAKGVTVHDVRSQLPRNGTFMSRPLRHIIGIAGHWDAEFRPLNYDSLARYVGQAWYHINKDWGGGARGDGLMYHFRIDNIGDVYITRNAEEVTWQVGNENYNYIGYCLDGLWQDPTREQAHAVEMLLDVLTRESPEIAAGQQNVKGHKEIPGNSTACPGNGLALIQNYRASGYVQEQNYVWEIDPSPAPPAPAPVATTWKDNLRRIERQSRRVSDGQALQLVNMETGQVVRSFPAGSVLDVEYITNHQGRDYYLTLYSGDKQVPNAFLGSDYYGKAVDDTIQPVPEPVPVPSVDPVLQVKADKYDRLVKEIKDLTTIIGD